MCSCNSEARRSSAAKIHDAFAAEQASSRVGGRAPWITLLPVLRMFSGFSRDPHALVGASANHDPRHFPHPDVFDIRRANAHTQLAFGWHADCGAVRLPFWPV